MNEGVIFNGTNPNLDKDFTTCRNTVKSSTCKTDVYWCVSNDEGHWWWNN